jgi:iron complex transport system ATP-binding protein
MLSQESGKTIIFSTHDLAVAMSQADKVWLILGDRLVEGAPEDLMLQGAFDHLFDSPAVHYNPDHGTYSFVSENRGDITVSGEGTALHYTRKALNRAGYSVKDGNSKPYLSVPSGDRKTWEYYNNGETISFSSIYDLVSWLNNR